MHLQVTVNDSHEEKYTNGEELEYFIMFPYEDYSAHNGSIKNTVKL